MKKAEALRDEILELVRRYGRETVKELPEGKVPVSGKVYGEDELANLVDASLKGWWTDGEYVEKFEEQLAEYIGTKYAVACNSGSSASLLAFAALTSHLIEKEKRIVPGDEVLTVSAGFPTTVNPIILYGCVPVFVEVEMGTYDVDVSELSKAVTNKTKAIFLAHTLGNPFDVDAVTGLAEEHGLWLIEDNCDALGSTYKGRMTGTFGHLATHSFYPAHHITTAEGGAVVTSDPLLDKIVRSIRDWGRDCWCKTGRDNRCGKRFTGRFGKLPIGYDHKYVYSHMGYNLKMTDLQAAIGVAQMVKLHSFTLKRKENFEYLKNGLDKYGDKLLLPEAMKESDPSWFGFPLSAVPGKVNRSDLTSFLEENGVATRPLFAGNMIKQPYYTENNIKYRVSGSLENTDYIMENTFWIGVYPGLGKKQLDHALNVFQKYFAGKKG